MAYIITDDCINCGACKGECPVECISEGDTKHVIDADACIECGNCAQVCPVDAPKQAEGNCQKRPRSGLFCVKGVGLWTG